MKLIFKQIRSNRRTTAGWARHLGRLAELAALAALAAPAQSLAQQPGQPKNQSSVSTDALAAQVRAAVTADTQSLVVGHLDFTRYTTPTFCLIAVEHALTIARRSIAAQEVADTMRRHPVYDTLPAQIVPVARGCAARFSVGTTPPAVLPDLFELALLGRQDSLAAAVVAHRAALAASPAARAAVLADAVDHYLAAAPARVAAAEAVVAQLDALGQGKASAAVLVSRMQAHSRLAQLGDSTGDVTRVQREAAQVLALARTLPRDSLTSTSTSIATHTLFEAYRTLALLVYVRAPDSLKILAQQFHQDVKSAPGLQDYAKLPLDSVVHWLLPVLSNGSEVGQPTTPLAADFWFPAKDTRPLGQGRVSLYIEIPKKNCYGGYGEPWVLDQIFTGCERVYSLVREWGARYDRAGLDMTLVIPTSPQITGTVLSGPQTPAEAAKDLDWFFRQYLKLPVQHVAVQMISVTEPLPTPDGRRFAQVPNEGERTPFHTPFDTVYHPVNMGPYGPALVLTGRDGRLVYSGGPSLVFNRLLAAVMTTPAVASPASPASPAAPAASTSPAPSAAVPPAPRTGAAHPQPGTL